MNKVTDSLKNKIIDKAKKIVYYISLGVIFVIIGLMLAMPFIVNKASFKGDDLVVFDKTINVMAMDGKVGIKVVNEYIKTPASYEKYDLYIKNFNKNSAFKTTFVLELYLLFVLIEAIFIYFIITNIIKLFIDTDDKEYNVYLTKKSFAINVISIYIFSFIRRFVFRKTVFSSLDFSLVEFYLFSLIMFFVVYKIIEMNKFSLLKDKKYEKTKKDN